MPEPLHLPSSQLEPLLREVLRRLDLAHEQRQPLWLEVPAACRCGETLRLDLAGLFPVGLLRQSEEGLPMLVFHAPQTTHRLEWRLRLASEPGLSPEGQEAAGLTLVESVLETWELSALREVLSGEVLKGSVAFSSWRLPCEHAVQVPLLQLGKRRVPLACARTRLEGDASLALLPSWPGLEACERCPYFTPGKTADCIGCSAPRAAEGAAGLSVELDIYRENGLKRRFFLACGLDLAERIRAHTRYPGAPRAARVDVKFVEGEASWLERQTDAFMERWRCYWNGERWIRKPRNTSLHDWNKWGRRLEYASTAEVGSLPPEGGWPPILDLPPGKYRLRVEQLQWKVGRKGEPELEWVFEVLSGKARGRKVFRRAPVRTSRMRALVLKDVGLLLERPADTLPEPGTPAFEALLPQLSGILTVGRVALRDDFVNLYLNRRPAGAARRHEKGS